ncbi:hypothetical protein Krac_3914 [Ktedonobacter racemifer DSM 44963]|uniref:Uncharacterized protein n=1 Tax=Ktedonobacter racemifer DSM 44963 TaxID=485913 RepID=D6U3L4_KTERA|nr:hypothetical protein Krac_3914 [Ktedonobacter racemifer DSM 44963]
MERKTTPRNRNSEKNARTGSLTIPGVFEFFFDLLTADLGIPSGRLDCWRAFLGHMAQIIRYFFQTPASFTRSVSKIMAQIVKRQIGNVFPLILCRSRFQVAEPVMNPFLGQPCVPLRRKDVFPLRIACHLEIVVEGLVGRKQASRFFAPTF